MSSDFLNFFRSTALLTLLCQKSFQRIRRGRVSAAYILHRSPFCPLEHNSYYVMPKTSKKDPAQTSKT